MDVKTKQVTSASPFPRGRGRTFVLLETTAAVTVTFYRNGSPFSKAEDVKGGYYASFEEPFEQVIIESSTTQNVQCGVGDFGGYNRSQGDVNNTEVIPARVVPQSDVSVAATGFGTIASQNSDRAEVIFYTDTDLKIGGSSPTDSPSASKGLLVKAGSTMVLKTTDDVRCYNIGPGTATIHVIEVQHA